MTIKELRLEKNQKIYEQFEIKRKSFIGSKTGERYYGYHIKGMLKGHPVKVNIKCKDNAGYKMLDIVFDGANKVYLMTTKAQIDKNIFTTYYAVSIDEEDGTLIRANIVPLAQSDQDTLFALLQKADLMDRLARKEAAEALEQEEEEETTQETDGVKHIDENTEEELVEEVTEE